MATFVMSYPGPSLGMAAAGPNDINPRAAFTEWLLLCDHMTRCGAKIFVLDPRYDADTPATDRLGTLFLHPQDGSPACFLLPESVDLVSNEVGAALSEAGLPVRRASQPFASGRNLISIGKNRFLLTYEAVDSAKEPDLSEVRSLLPTGARVLPIALRPGYTEGSQCLCALATLGGDVTLLVRELALLSSGQGDLGRFAGPGIDICPITQDDEEAHVCSAISSRGNVILPTGSSSQLRGRLVRRGFTLVEVDLPHLYGAGLYPRTLVNELYGFVLSESAPSYALRREELHQLALSYPTSPGPRISQEAGGIPEG